VSHFSSADIKFATLEYDTVRESGDCSGYIVCMISLRRRQREADTARRPRGVFVPGFKTCSEGKAV
jgi:hypothetical protein